MKIGATGEGCGFPWRGLIDEVEIYNRALSAEEIQQTYAAGSALRCNTATLWIGLKNSDDQGTQFDLRAEVYRNGTFVAAGETKCITGVTRNPNLAKKVTVPIGQLSGFGLGDTLSLKLLTRIGTNADGTRCSGPGGSHSNAVGLRLYYDSTTRSSALAATVGSNPMRDYFLHSLASNLFLNATPPTSSTAKFQDSPGINFAQGNPWKEIGAWNMPVQ
jgi:hypothetical protein